MSIEPRQYLYGPIDHRHYIPNINGLNATHELLRCLLRQSSCFLPLSNYGEGDPLAPVGVILRSPSDGKPHAVTFPGRDGPTARAAGELVALLVVLAQRAGAVNNGKARCGVAEDLWDDIVLRLVGTGDLYAPGPLFPRRGQSRIPDPEFPLPWSVAVDTVAVVEYWYAVWKRIELLETQGESAEGAEKSKAL